MASVLVGLTGGIGAGKSTVARLLGARGARLIDADAVARDVVDPGSPEGAVVLAQIAALLGPGALRPDGTLDRAEVGRLIFADDALRLRYNAILHPVIRDRIAHRIARAREAGGVTVQEIPLLSGKSAPLPWSYDLIVTVEAAEDVRAERLQRERGMSAAEAHRRIRAQGAEADRVEIADVVIRTEGPLDQTLAAADALWQRLSG